MGRKTVPRPTDSLEEIASGLLSLELAANRIACHAKTVEDLEHGYATVQTDDEKDWLRSTLHDRIVFEAERLEKELRSLSLALTAKRPHKAVA